MTAADQFTVYYFTKLLEDRRVSRAFLQREVLPRLESLGLTAARAELQRLVVPAPLKF